LGIFATHDAAVGEIGATPAFPVCAMAAAARSRKQLLARLNRLRVHLKGIRFTVLLGMVLLRRSDTPKDWQHNQQN
jgi:hypothetical protein